MQMYTTTMTQPDPERFMNQYCSWEVSTKANKWQGRNITRWRNDEYDKAYRAAEVELDPVKRAALFIKMNDLVVSDSVVIPLVSRPRVRGAGAQARGARCRAGTATSGHCRTGTGRPERRCGAEAPGRGHLPPAPPADRRCPACWASASCCSRCWRWRRAIRSRSSPPTPTCRPRCAPTCARKFGLDDPVLAALPALAGRDAAGRLGLLVRQPHQRRHADPAAPADDARW